jgi:septum formation protein
MYDFFYLASQSPRRHQILRDIGASFKPLDLIEGVGPDADFDESILEGENPLAYVSRVSMLKARAGQQYLRKSRLVNAPVLSADTTVAINEIILGKPVDENDARQMLERLSGQTHDVISVVSMYCEDKMEQKTSVTEVTMKQLSNDEIQRYIESNEPFGKAGGYGIQGQASLFISRIEGSYSGVMGLPIFETARLLESFGFNL